MKAKRVGLLLGLLAMACLGAAGTGQRKIVRPPVLANARTAAAATSIQPALSSSPVATSAPASHAGGMNPACPLCYLATQK